LKNHDKVKDSGKRTEFSTGSVRDDRKGKGRNDLLPFLSLQKVSQHFENGTNKYGDRNWECGQPLSVYFDSAFRHMVKHFIGLNDEDHLSAAIWNLMALQETQIRINLGILPKKLDDLPQTYKDENLQSIILEMFGEK